MIEITERAQTYFRNLLEQQDIEGLGIRLGVADGGTPAAECELAFGEASELERCEHVAQYTGFKLYTTAADDEWLEGARIDIVPTPTGGELSIRAPSIKGHVPAADAALVERVQYVIDAEVNPQIASHGGRVALIEVTAEGTVVLEFGGGCHGCGMVDVTLKQGVEKTLRARVPDVKAVRDVTDHTTGSNPYYTRREGDSAMG
ncbi:MAG TPA: NfuA family Fe-S biogenesis protein [Oleiagrimonas sp.]|nr:NfuA family Fe-S biogenesis protein [Oleiagrimonas sp.]